MAIISAVTNSNGGIYVSLMNIYGDETDVASVSLLSINDGPFLTLVAMGASGLASIDLMSLVSTILPIIIGIVIVVILILIIVMQHRRLNKIRANKRNRNR